MMKMNKSVLALMTVLLLSASLVAAVYVFMLSGDQTIKSGDTASFTCTVDPMLGTAYYEIRIIGPGVNKVLKSGTSSESAFDVTVSVGPGDYGAAGDYTVRCYAKEQICDPCCCDEDIDDSTLKICPQDLAFCSGDLRKKTVYDVNNNCADNTTTDEDCNIKNGCSPYGNGCEDRDYYCVTGGLSCDYLYTNRNTDYYNNYVAYCEGSLVKKHRKLHNFYCGTMCTDHVSWTDDQVVENCDSKDKWYDTGNTQWIDNGVCKEKQQKEQVYKDYSCSAGSCTYVNTSTQWIDTGSTRNKADGTVCNDDLYCTNPDTCLSGNCQGPDKDCSDDLFCTVNEQCDEVLDTCTSEPRSCVAFNISGISTCDNNPDNYHFTFDFRMWFTSICDDSNDKCTTRNDSITHTCDKDCDAECETDADCDDQNPHTNDYCIANCTCKHDSEEYCGDGIVTGTEICELPSTSNNAYCGQTSTSCNGTKLGARDLFGNCNANCGCTPDNFIYSCVKDQCGATCSTDGDCADFCEGDTKHSSGTCDLTTSCSCNAGTTYNCNDLDGWQDTGSKRWSNSTVCNEKEQKEQKYRNYTCGTSPIVNCTYTETGTQWIDTGASRFKPNGTTCDDGLYCTTGDICVEGQCGGTSQKNCSAFNFGKIDTCYNNPDNNPYTWDHRDAFISTCDEYQDRCITGNDTITHQCKDKECAAECLIDEDCNDYNPLSTDTCLNNCSCNHEWHPGCGDGILQTGELCDDGNFLSGDGCSASCTVEVKTSSSSGGSSRSGGGGGSITTTSWTCGEWSTCVDDKQTRTCSLNSASKTETQSCKVTPAPTVTETQSSESDGPGPVEQTQGSVVTNSVPLKTKINNAVGTDPVSSVLSKTNSITGAVVSGTSTGTMMTGMFLLALVGVLIASLLLRR